MKDKHRHKEEEENESVDIFADGACFGNPGPGGYGIILRYGNREKEISGYCENTTNNRMELMAVIRGLESLKRPMWARVFTDSNYVFKGITEWIHSWQRRNWLNSQKKPVANKDLWERLSSLSEQHKVEWRWVKGHARHPENERCDNLAKQAIKENVDMRMLA